ncbi:MAG: CRTAC1 family protein [Bacteroidota bacterium]
MLTLSSFAGCGNSGSPESKPTDLNSTSRMVAELSDIYEQATTDPMPYVHLNRRRAVHMKKEAQQLTGEQAMVYRFIIARELLQAGQSEQAIMELLQIMKEIGEDPYLMASENKPLFDELALAYLRLGEQQNCIERHTAESCIMPIEGAGVQVRQEGVRNAIALYENILRRFNNDFGSRWLLNVAYMSIGGYPESVPAPFLIKGLAPQPDSLFPRFPNIATDLGVAVNSLSGGLSIEDFNGDGHLDLFMTSYGLNDPIHFFLADGLGGYVDHTQDAGLTGIVSGLNTIHADYDNDGATDIFILRGAWLADAGNHPNSLLRNKNDGTFEDVTFDSGLLSRHPTQTGAWADFNLDGHLDLFIGNESNTEWQDVLAKNRSQNSQPHPSELYLNRGDGTFTEVAKKVGIDLETFVKAVVWGDVNNDGLPDLFVSVLGEPNRLYVNQGGVDVDHWRFEEQAEKAGVQNPVFSFPAWFWDFDNDGWEDLFVSSYDLRHFDQLHSDITREYMGLAVQAEYARLFRNNGDGTFSDVTGAAGLDKALYSMGSNFGDLDNDGWLDFYLGTGAPDLRSIIPNRMFHSRKGQRFEEITFIGGFGHTQKGHALAFADLDRDGDDDIYGVMGGAVEGDVFPNVLFQNPDGWNTNKWINLELEGRTANRSAIGARIELTVKNTDGLSRKITRTVRTGGSFGAGSLQQKIGLGQAASIERLRVIWPNAQQTTETHTGLTPNNFYRIVEGETPLMLNRPPVPFNGDAGASQPEQ